MELVIKIDDAEYNKICNYDGMNVTRMMSTIRNGIPLSKDHGDLIDKDQFEQLLRNYGLDYEADTFIPMATTVIESDKVDKNGTDN